MARPQRRVIHLDMDAFFAAVEALDDPGLKGLPVIVGGLGPRGVVSTASYEARAYGVRSAQPMSLARRLCPGGVYLAPRLKRYQEVSGRVMDIFRRYTPLVEPLSLDEAFLEVGGCRRLFGPAEDIARRIKAETLAETGLIVSAGVAGQKSLAKIASSRGKPDGLLTVPAGGEKDFLRDLPLKELWGVGPAMLDRLARLGLASAGDLAALEPEFLAERFGRAGRHLWLLANGLDEREVEPVRTPRSVSAEETFSVDLSAPDDIRAALLDRALAATDRLRRKGLKAGRVSVKFRDGRFKTLTRARTLAAPTDLRDEIHRAVLDIYRREAPGLGPLRLVGVALEALSAATGAEAAPAARPSLFGPSAEERRRAAVRGRAARLNQALDLAAERFGNGALRPATLLEDADIIRAAPGEPARGR